MQTHRTKMNRYVSPCDALDRTIELFFNIDSVVMLFLQFIVITLFSPFAVGNIKNK